MYVCTYNVHGFFIFKQTIFYIFNLIECYQNIFQVVFSQREDDESLETSTLIVWTTTPFETNPSEQWRSFLPGHNQTETPNSSSSCKSDN